MWQFKALLALAWMNLRKFYDAIEHWDAGKCFFSFSRCQLVGVCECLRWFRHLCRCQMTWVAIIYGLLVKLGTVFAMRLLEAQTGVRKFVLNCAFWCFVIMISTFFLLVCNDWNYSTIAKLLDFKLERLKMIKLKCTLYVHPSITWHFFL